MKCPVPQVHWTNDLYGVRYRTRVFTETFEWKMGDLLKINGDPALFISVKFQDRELGKLGSNEWEGILGSVIVLDADGIHEMTAEEFLSTSDETAVISRIDDLSL